MRAKVLMAILAVGAMLSLPASAAFLDFRVLADEDTGVPNSTPEQLALISFTVEVTDGGAGNVLFTFNNVSDADLAPVITQIYFHDTFDVISGGSVDEDASSGVIFVVGDPTPGADNLPGANTIGFVASEAWNAYATSPAPQNGVGVGDTLVLDYDAAFGDVMSGLRTGDFRVGLHIQSIGEESDSFVTTIIPEPTSIALLSFGLLGVATTRLRRRS